MAEEKVLNNEAAAESAVQYDDAAEQAKYLEQREKQHAEDFAKPFDPDAILEVRHLRKCFPLKKTMLGKVTRELVAVDVGGATTDVYSIADGMPCISLIDYI